MMAVVAEEYVVDQREVLYSDEIEIDVSMGS